MMKEKKPFPWMPIVVFLAFAVLIGAVAYGVVSVTGQLESARDAAQDAFRRTFGN